MAVGYGIKALTLSNSRHVLHFQPSFRALVGRKNPQHVYPHMQADRSYMMHQLRGRK